MKMIHSPQANAVLLLLIILHSIAGLFIPNLKKNFFEGFFLFLIKIYNNYSSDVTDIINYTLKKRK